MPRPSQTEPHRVHRERHRAESFGGVADEYDQARPSYPAGLIDDLVAKAPVDALDVGCGTGKAARLLIERGVTVTGVEIDAQMATVARRHGVDVEVAAFEQWVSRGRIFDLVVSAQAWHWVDPAVGVAKAAELLRPAGTLAVFWNTSTLERPLQRALDAVYRRFAPGLLRPTSSTGPDDPPYVADLTNAPHFASVETRAYPWEHRYSSAEWVRLVQTHSDHVVLDAERRARLVDGIARAIDDCGGTVAAHYDTYAVLARMPGAPA